MRMSIGQALGIKTTGDRLRAAERAADRRGRKRGLAQGLEQGAEKERKKLTAFFRSKGVSEEIISEALALK